MTTTPTITGVRTVGRVRGWIPAVLCGAALIVVALITLWLRQVTSHVYQNGAEAITIRAVLRTNAEPDSIEKLASRLSNSVPGAQVETIDDAMGRSLLALQEPWIADMPDFEITPLPTLIEIKHPRLLTAPLEIARFVEELKADPIVDFVAYNETAHDKLVKISESTGQIQNHTIRWILLALIVTGVCTQIAFGIITPAGSLLGVFVRQAGLWLAAWLLGVVLFKAWEGTAVATGEWQRLASSSYFAVGMASLGIMLLAELINIFSAWWKR